LRKTLKKKQTKNGNEEKQQIMYLKVERNNKRIQLALQKKINNIMEKYRKYYKYLKQKKVEVETLSILMKYF